MTNWLKPKTVWLICKGNEMKYEFEAGDTSPIGDDDVWEATIDHKTPDGGAHGIWYAQLHCLGNTEAKADALRDRVLDALQDEGKLAAMKERAEKSEALVRMLVLNVLSSAQCTELDPEELASIEAIIKMPGLGNDS